MLKTKRFVLVKLRETAPRPTSDDVGHVHASLDRGRRPRRHAKCAISDTHVLRQGMAGRMQPAAALWSRIAARGGGRSAPIDASGDVSAERKLTGYCPRWFGKELAASTVPACHMLAMPRRESWPLAEHGSAGWFCWPRLAHGCGRHKLAQGGQLRREGAENRAGRVYVHINEACFAINSRLAASLFWVASVCAWATEAPPRPVRHARQRARCAGDGHCV